MTRKRMRDTIRQRLEDYQLPLNDETKAVADAAVDCALEYVLTFAQDVSEELTRQCSYSEAMVAGVFVRKLKGLLGE